MRDVGGLTSDHGGVVCARLWKSVLNDREMVPWINALHKNTTLTSLE